MVPRSGDLPGVEGDDEGAEPSRGARSGGRFSSDLGGRFQPVDLKWRRSDDRVRTASDHEAKIGPGRSMEGGLCRELSQGDDQVDGASVGGAGATQARGKSRRLDWTDRGRKNHHGREAGSASISKKREG